MYHLKETNAETITDCLKDILLRCNLLLDNCRWQAYDGAATMSGHLSGVAARITTENPAAHRIHCANHRLDLALKGCAKESEIIRETLTFVQDLAVFIRNSPKRMSIYEDIAKDVSSDGSVDSLHLLCPTRWTVRTKSVSAILSNYSSIHATLLKIANESSIHDVSDKAYGLAGKMVKFKTYLGERFALNLFSVCEQLARTLQTKGITAQTAMVGVTALKGNLQQQTEDFSLFYKQTIAKAAELDFVEEPKLPRRRQVPRRLQILEAPHHHYESAEAFYRASYYEAIDACLAELNRRFDEASYAPLQNLEDVFLNAANDQPFQFSKQVCESYGKQVDFEEAGAQLKFIPSVIRQYCPGVKKVTSMETIFSAISSCPTNQMLLPSVMKLAQIYLLAPMSAASAERSFSVQRRIKHYSRSRMTEKRYNNLMMLNIHKEKTDAIDLIKIARDFTQRSDKRRHFFGKF
eukprot:Seg1527.3 transcript_id=Seg1527.3/GoldUCD/mRNA.D3Y31 product="Zinc finger MYM-type protein 1" protein_id=Seg1527.3/GoldUCD/D3Y31